MKKVTRRKFIKRISLALIGLFLIDAFWFEKYIIDWKYFDISNTSEDKIKIIQISDLHINEIRYFHKSIAKKINLIKPDLIVITGDSVDDNKYIETLDKFLKLIDYPIKKIAITGNWEYWGNIDLGKLSSVYTNNNCELLINQNTLVNIRSRDISVIGIDDYIGGNANFDKAIKNIKPSQTNIVLSHCPQHRDIIASENKNLKIDLVLSGHTHGGQISFLGIVPFKPKGSGKYLKGWYKEKKTKLYVSKGVGTSILPIRFGARAEITEFDI